jgi:hypothetical protein
MLTRNPVNLHLLHAPKPVSKTRKGVLDSCDIVSRLLKDKKIKDEVRGTRSGDHRKLCTRGHRSKRALLYMAALKVRPGRSLHNVPDERQDDLLELFKGVRHGILVGKSIAFERRQMDQVDYLAGARRPELLGLDSFQKGDMKSQFLRNRSARRKQPSQGLYAIE